MKKRTITKTDSVTINVRTLVVLTLTLALGLTFMTGSLIRKPSTHSPTYCLTQGPASAGLVVFAVMKKALVPQKRIENVESAFKYFLTGESLKWDYPDTLRKQGLNKHKTNTKAKANRLSIRLPFSRPNL